MLNGILMRFILFKLFFVIIFLNLEPAKANLEVSAHGGIYLNKRIPLRNLHQDLLNSEAKPWIFGGDLLYLLPVPRLHIGFRYQYYMISDGQYSESIRSGALDGPFNMNIHRIGILLKYQLLDVDSESNEGFFVGLLMSLDIFKYMKFEFDENVDVGTASNIENLTSQGWLGISPLSGQIGLDFGFRWTQGFFVKGEVGYSLLAFDNFKCDRNDCGIEDETLNLIAPYGLLGVGLVFDI